MNILIAKLLQAYLVASTLITLILIMVVFYDSRVNELITKSMPTFKILDAKILVTVLLITTIPIVPFIVLYTWYKK